MLAQRKDTEAGVIGKLGGGNDLLQALCGVAESSVGPLRRQVAERVESDLHLMCPSSRRRCGDMTKLPQRNTGMDARQ